MLQSDFHFGSVIRGIIFLILVLVFGTVWFSTVEGFTLVEGLYMTVITISTVGFKEVHELDTSGRIFVVLLIISGLTILTYTLGAVGRVIVEGTIERYVGRRKMLHEIEKLKDHYIICGHGRIGEILCDELLSESVNFVVIEGNPEKAEMLSEKGFMVIEGDATEDETLGKAGVKNARGLVAVVSNNVDNLYITLSAREMCRSENPNLYILSRATDDRASEKITRAGADRVISPYVIGGMRIVQALLRPAVYDFVDIATQSSGLDLMFEEMAIGLDGQFSEVALKDSNLRQSYDVIVIAIKKPSGRMIFNPGPEVILEADDVMIVLGDKGQLERLAQSIK